MFMGQDGFVWWIGVVEDNNDPLLIGRARVRIFGYHPAYKPTEDSYNDQENNVVSSSELPWAVPVMSINMANTYNKIELGQWVCGFFLDGKESQEPAIIGMIPSAYYQHQGFGKYATARNFSSIAIEGDNSSRWDFGEASNRFDWRSPSGHAILISENGDQDFLFYHKAGMYFRMMRNRYGSNDIVLSHPKGSNIQLTNDGKAYTFGVNGIVIYHSNSGSNIQITPDGNIHLSAAAGRDIYVNGVGGSYALTQKIKSMDAEIEVAKTLPVATGGGGGGGGGDGGSGGQGGEGGGGGGGGGKIICTKLFELGLLPYAIYEADQQFGAELNDKHPDIYDGYYAWAIIVVQWMEGNGPDCMLWIRNQNERRNAQIYLSRKWAEEIATPWAKQMAYMMGVEPKSNLTGKVLMSVGIPICKVIGVWRRVFGKATKPAGIVKGYALWGVFTLLRATVSIMSLFDRGDKQ